MNNQWTLSICNTKECREVDHIVRKCQMVLCTNTWCSFHHTTLYSCMNWFFLHFSAEKCCNFPACYDSIYSLCIDTCRPKDKCGSNVDPRGGSTVWVPCPIRLSLPDCNSKILSPLGKLPLECYPDIPEILPVSFLARTGQTISSYFRVRILKPFFTLFSF